MDATTIDVKYDNDFPCFIIKGSFSKITQNKRLLFSLKRLDCELKDDVVMVPFSMETQILVLQEIRELLSKFGFTQELSVETKNEVESYDRENTLFTEFSLKAKSIRNDEFKAYPELIEDYKSFKYALNTLLHRKLYPLQELSAFHMAFAQNSCNFAVPGAGKTSIVYSAYAFLKSLPADHPKHVDKLLVIGPLSSFAPWENEYVECFGKTTTFKRLSGDATISRDEKLEHLYSGNPAEVTLIFHGGIDSLQEDILEFLKKNKTMVVVDEAHRIKNPEGVWGQSVVEISKEAKSRVILTGTPLPNGYQDVYNLYRFIYPFKYKEILKVHYHNLEDMTYNSLPDSVRVTELKENLSPFFIRIRKDDLNLPPLEENVIKIEMERYQREIYDFIEASYIDSFRQHDSGTIRDILNRAKLIRLRQASTNPALLAKTLKDSLANNESTGEYDPNSVFTDASDEFVNDSEFFHKICNYANFETPQKFVEIKKILIEKEILSSGGKAIIWTIFIQNAKDLQAYLLNHNIQSRLLIGEVGQDERELTIGKFNDPNNKDFQVVIANPFAVAESISLHKGCHNAIYLERDYNCANFLQSKDRIYRVGLDKNQVTNYYYVIAKNSIDEIIDTRLKAKVERMEKIINDDIPLFNRVNDSNETDIIKDLIRDYATRT
jgi:SNF2 family DNA or RNA helicase